jgi:cell division protein FtsQ
MRLPSVPRVRIGWRVVSLGLVALLSLVLYQLWNSPDYRVDAVEVVGLQRLTAGDVNAALGVTGKPIFALDTTDIQDQLFAVFPEFSAASVEIDLPNSVVVTVTERVPVIIWHQDGRDELVDAEGMAFPAREDLAEGNYPVVEALSEPPPLPLQEPQEDILPIAEFTDLSVLALSSTGLPISTELKPLLSPDMVQAILVMSDRAPQGALLFYESRHGLGWEDRRGWKAYFGNPEDVKMKLHVYQAIVQRLKSEGIQPAMISIEYVHKPFYRLEP